MGCTLPSLNLPLSKSLRLEGDRHEITHLYSMNWHWILYHEITHLYSMLDRYGEPKHDQVGQFAHHSAIIGGMSKLNLVSLNRLFNVK